MVNSQQEYSLFESHFRGTFGARPLASSRDDVVTFSHSALMKR